MFSRRRFFTALSAPLWVPLASAGISTNYHFTLGVASGCPRSSSVVLWTRLAPDPSIGGGMPEGAVEVRYRVCSDSAMRNTILDGLVRTDESKAHSIHVTAKGLEPGREYWYQFYFGEDDSPIGRTRTTDPNADSVKLAFANCQHYETNFYAAYKDLAQWNPDAIIHLGDYIYEGAKHALGKHQLKLKNSTVAYEIVRQHDGPEAATLYQYRNRHALYKGDPQLQAAHAAAPWIVSLDDHEVDNNWAGEFPEDPKKQTPLEFAIRKRAALQAFYEHMPIERPVLLSGVNADLPLYDEFEMGPASVSMLDTRQYRSQPPCGQGFPSEEACEEMHDPNLTMTGKTQENWLLERIKRSESPFNIIAQQSWFAPFNYGSEDEDRFNMDQWDGYPVQRQKLINAFDHSTSESIVMSGDWHCAAAMGIHKDPTNSKTARVAHNFAATSISSLCPWLPVVQNAKNQNPHVDYIGEDQRGYIRCEVSKKRAITSFRTVHNPKDPHSHSTTEIQYNISSS